MNSDTRTLLDEYIQAKATIMAAKKTRDRLALRLAEAMSDMGYDASVMELNVESTVEPTIDTAKIAPKKPNFKSTRRARTPDHAAAAKRYADFEPADAGCICGCGEDAPDGRDFKRGHQHRLRSIALAVDNDKLGFDKICPRAYAHIENADEFSEDLRNRCRMRLASTEKSAAE